MRKLLNKPWFVGLLALAAAIVVGQAILDRPAPRAATPYPENDFAASDPEGEDPAAPTPGSLAEVLTAITLPERVQDPFAPRQSRAAPETFAAESADQVTETVRLSAIWAQGDAIFIVLNGRICRPGDTIGRVTLAAVEPDGVWLAHDSGREFLRLGQTFTLVVPAAPAANPNTVSHEG